jgi:hypothetical protein
MAEPGKLAWSDERGKHRGGSVVSQFAVLIFFLILILIPPGTRPFVAAEE